MAFVRGKISGQEANVEQKQESIHITLTFLSRINHLKCVCVCVCVIIKRREGEGTPEHCWTVQHIFSAAENSVHP